METHNHQVLKWKAVEWLYLNRHCKFIAQELKYGRYIFDVVGSDGKKIYIIEAKQERQDFLRECNSFDEIKENINEYKKLIKETGEIDTYKELIEKERNKSWKFYDSALVEYINERYIICPDNMIKEEELPPYWGLLNEEPRMILESQSSRIEQRKTDKIIKEICKKNTKDLLRKHGVEFGRHIEFPNFILE